MRNLSRITNYYNRLEAWKLWRATEQEAIEQGVSAQAIKKIAPMNGAGWRIIDQATNKLRELIKESVK